MGQEQTRNKPRQEPTNNQNSEEKEKISISQLRGEEPLSQLPRRNSFKIVIKRVERPMRTTPEEEFHWLCETLGFFEPIDKDKTASQIFREIVTATEKGTALTSTAIADRVGMSRGAVINHLNNLLRSGLITRNGRYYSARSRRLANTIEEIQEDIERIFSRMRKAALDFDEQF